MATREDMLRSPRSGARALGGSDPGPGESRSYPRYSRSGSVPSGSNGTRRAAPNAAAAPKPAPSSAQRNYRVARQAAPTQAIHRGNYQNIILVEFVACILLTALTPIATKKNQDGLSPYAGKDLVKLGSITLLYFILAAVSVTAPGAGRVAAWFGGLILITDGMLEASNIAKDIAVITGSTGTPAAAATTPQNAGAAPTQGA
jgi:hypothetical protein